MKVSIILPTLRYDKARLLLRSLRDYSVSDYEVILVTNDDIADNIEGQLLYALKREKYVIDDKCIGTTHAIQLGLHKAIGDYVVCLSDDCLVTPRWDKNMIDFLEAQPKDKIVIGNFVVYDGTGCLPHIGYYGCQFSPFPMISRENLNRMGTYYSTEYNAFYSDPDLGMRLIAHGGEIINCPHSFIFHPFNPDQLHINNKSKYWAKDEETFIRKWNHLGEFKGCEVIK